MVSAFLARHPLCLTAATLTINLAAPATAKADCADWQPTNNVIADRARPIAAADMIELANFGGPDSEPSGGAPLALSPDGIRVAFVLQRADLDTNGYCQALVVVDLSGEERPRVLDRGGDFIFNEFPFRGIAVKVGAAKVNTPAWSADGRSIGYFRRDRDSTQVWVARLDGSPARQVTHAPVDVEDWRWEEDGHALRYRTSPGRVDAERAIEQEGLQGWHYDARFEPMYGIRPQTPAPQPARWTSVNVTTGAATPVSDDTENSPGDEARPVGRDATNPRGDTATLEPNSASPLARQRLVVSDRRGEPYRCGDVCDSGLSSVWWEPSGGALTFIKHEGWHDRFTAIYRWVPGSGAPSRILQTDDVIDGCLPAERRLVCTREGAMQSPRLVVIDRIDGSQQILFDPNPGFGLLDKGRVTRLEWRNDIGREVYGDLVVPSGYRGDRKLSTVIVQYRSRGLPRGGTGNEYPIFLLAQQGFAVLSIQSPRWVAESDPTIRSNEDVARADTKNWAERNNTLSAVESGVRLLIERGVADPARIGITGLSDGASTVRYALINSDLFAAAAVSTCCVDESSDTLVGPAWADFSERIGYPPAYPIDVDFWRHYSLVLNAARIDTPLLLQLADEETLYGLPTYTALKAYDQPVDLYVFPDEHHIKWQPNHRAAVFERSIDWFSFWLQGREDPAPAKSEQYQRWRALRAARGHTKAQTGSRALQP
ncbi:Atxe2 family lasso peptide isopeptidase [Hephaestia sp. GCM10023244]|uniref:Atxe2 family lasso peptide isopeptidase n=1 Tax=unclassified Hephaestia TaxID=2631281 RepID=UPI00207792DE|nr:Atxe2 family lasso peptide isopeptidase [Hephaestia sp. MAHUQ-44]MCM8732417.1 Atxe2 family lasso peptide isopeptidase [Hephaestia sp. MAHUQ-44]